MVHASEDENPALFWALRGGGGNFGVVTGFEFALHAVGPIVYGGLIAYPFAAARDMLGFYRDLTAEPPDELTVVAGLTHAPDSSGTKLAALLSCHCGTEAEAGPALAPIKAFATPVVDQLGPLSYTGLNQMLDAGFPKLALNYWKSRFVDRLNDEVIAILQEQFAQCPSPMSKLVVEHFHGAAVRHAKDATSFPHRRKGYSILIIAQWQDKAASDRNIAWARDTDERLRPHAGDGAYSNYMGGDEAFSRVKQSFGANFARLQQVKDRYDPANLFHLNQNIPPST